MSEPSNAVSHRHLIHRAIQVTDTIIIPVRRNRDKLHALKHLVLHWDQEMLVPMRRGYDAIFEILSILPPSPALWFTLSIRYRPFGPDLTKTVEPLDIHLCTLTTLQKVTVMVNICSPTEGTRPRRITDLHDCFPRCRQQSLFIFNFQHSYYYSNSRKRPACYEDGGSLDEDAIPRNRNHWRY